MQKESDALCWEYGLSVVGEAKHDLVLGVACSGRVLMAPSAGVAVSRADCHNAAYLFGVVGFHAGVAVNVEIITQ